MTRRNLESSCAVDQFRHQTTIFISMKLASYVQVNGTFSVVVHRLVNLQSD